jgi:hypothetical protein
MAKKKSSKKGSSKKSSKKSSFKKGAATKPTMGIYFSHKKGKKTYINGPNFGLWPSESDKVEARGTLKGDRLEELITYLKKRAKAEDSVNAALLKHKKKGRDEEDEEEDEDEDEEDEDEDEDEDDDDDDDDDDDEDDDD